MVSVSRLLLPGIQLDAFFNVGAVRWLHELVSARPHAIAPAKPRRLAIVVANVRLFSRFMAWSPLCLYSMIKGVAPPRAAAGIRARVLFQLT